MPFDALSDASGDAAPDARRDAPGDAPGDAREPDRSTHGVVPAGWTGLPPLAATFRSPLNRLEPRETLRAKQLADRASVRLRAALGPDTALATGTAHGAAAVMAEHTRYVDGFALHLSLRQSAAASAAPADAPRIVGADETIVGADETGGMLRLLGAVLDALGAAPHAVAIETTLPDAFADVRLVAIAVALARAVAPGASAARHASAARAAAESVLGIPVSLSDAAASAAACAGTLVLSDAASAETLALDVPTSLAWGLVPTGEARTAVRVAALARRAARAREHVTAVSRPIASLREVEHEELAALLDASLPRHRSALAYLVGENRRVQRFVAALRTGDAQMMGAILAISARARDDWAGLTRAERAALDALDARTGEGVLGAADVGHARALLVLARPAALQSALAAAAAALGVEADEALVV